MPPVKPSFRRTPALAAQRGFSLLEILITMLIVAIGSLGIAGVILTGLRATNSSAERAVATQLASSFIEKMNMNPYLKLSTDPLGSGYGSPWNGVFTMPACFSGGGFCGINDLTRVHLDEFRTAVATQLPRGLMRVANAGASPNRIAVTVAWFEQAAVSRTGVTDSVNGCAGVVPAPPATVNQCVTITTLGE